MDGGGLVQSLAVAAVCVAAAASWWVTGSKKKESKPAVRTEAEQLEECAPVVEAENTTKAAQEHVELDVVAATELKSDEQEPPRRDVTNPVRTLEQSLGLACRPVVEPSGGAQFETLDNSAEETTAAAAAAAAGVGIEDEQDVAPDDEDEAVVAGRKNEVVGAQEIPVVLTASDPPIAEQQQEREESEAIVASEQSDAREMKERVQDDDEEQKEKERIVEQVEEQELGNAAEHAVDEEIGQQQQQPSIEELEQAQSAPASQALEEEVMVLEEIVDEPVAIIGQAAEADPTPEQVNWSSQKEDVVAKEQRAQHADDDGEVNDATSTDASCADHEELQPEMLVHAHHAPRLEVRFLDRYSESNVSTDFSFDEATSTAPGTEDTASSGQGEHELALTPPYRPSEPELVNMFRHRIRDRVKVHRHYPRHNEEAVIKVKHRQLAIKTGMFRKQKQIVPLRDVTEVLIGKQTEIFLTTNASKLEENVCFSLVTRDGTTYDFEATSELERDMLVAGFLRVLDSYRNPQRRFTLSSNASLQTFSSEGVDDRDTVSVSDEYS